MEKWYPDKNISLNKDFRDKNFGKGSIDGVFTLGQATKEEIEAIQKMQEERSAIKEKGIKKKESLTKLQSDKSVLEAEFKETIWLEAYKKYESDFKDAFVGVLKKEAFKAKLLDEFKTNSADIKSFDVLKEKAGTIFGEVPMSMQLISEIKFDKIVEIENNKIWQKKIIGKADVQIAQLIQKLNLNDWVNEGRGYLLENETCPFCQQQTISQNFKAQLEDYFDESFTKDIDIVKTLSEEYRLHAENLSNLIHQIETIEKSNPETKLQLDSFSAFSKTLISQFVTNKQLLDNKAKEPSRSCELVSVKEQLDNILALIKEANTLIREHNNIVANYAAERSTLIKFVWKYIIEENRTKILSFNKKVDGFKRGIDALQKQHKELQDQYTLKTKEIKEANKNVTSVQPSVDEINKTLKSYGFFNFEIVPSKTEQNQYQIQREDGTVAESTLSEGEITFITFLYFLQLSKGGTTQETITDERVLIVDDPISSLDSNVLFVVSSLIKEIIKKIKKDQGIIKQLILFTHNVYFHKEVSFIDGRTTENIDTAYWILRRNKNTSSIQSYGARNPIHNSYELLWSELKNRASLSGVSIQNVMRRIIENYFKILGRYGDDDLIQQFGDHQEQEICRSLLCWINDGSHSIPDDLYIEHNDSTSEKYFEVFKKIFYRMGHPEHYNMMMGEV